MSKIVNLLEFKKNKEEKDLINQCECLESTDGDLEQVRKDNEAKEKERKRKQLEYTQRYAKEIKHGGSPRGGLPDNFR